MTRLSSTGPLAVIVATMALASGSAAASLEGGRPGAPPKGYETSRAETLREGRALARLVVAGDDDALYARFAPELASQVSKASLEEVLQGTLAQGRIGARLGESAAQLAPSVRAYIADHRWAGRVLGIQLVFDARGRISSALLQPRNLPPDPKAGYRQKTRLRLPFSSTWWVFWGGPTERQNYHVVAPDQRHAYDIVVWKRGGTYRGDGRQNADYWCWGLPVLAPADATVAVARDGIRENRPQVETNASSPAGNHVVLDFGNGEFALLAHFQRGSVRVRAGERVEQGQILGRCGNSGNSSEPHLHFHVQDRKRLFGAAKGLPAAFSDYLANGRRVARGVPLQGQFVRNP